MERTKMKKDRDESTDSGLVRVTQPRLRIADASEKKLETSLKKEKEEDQESSVELRLKGKREKKTSATKKEPVKIKKEKKEEVAEPEEPKAKPVQARKKSESSSADEIKIPAVYFSPDIKDVLVKLIRDETKSIQGACYQFTLFDLASLWVECVQEKKLRSALVVDDVLDFFKDKECNYISLVHALIWLKLNSISVSTCQLRNANWKEFGGTGNMHHKFFIFGKNCNTHGPIVVTGSFNWTGQADVRNWEDLVILNDADLIKAYKAYYKKLPLKDLDIPLLILYRKREEKLAKNLDKSKKLNGITGSAEKRLDKMIEGQYPEIEQEVEELEENLKK